MIGEELCSEDCSSMLSEVGWPPANMEGSTNTSVFLIILKALMWVFKDLFWTYFSWNYLRKLEELLTIVNLKNFQLSTLQLNTLFSSILDGETKLRELQVSSNDLCQVPAQLLSQAIIRLKVCDLINCNLTSCQLKAIVHDVIKTEETIGILIFVKMICQKFQRINWLER